jgi:uncharacterized membrane protein (TIGR02234 family)
VTDQQPPPTTAAPADQDRPAEPPGRRTAPRSRSVAFGLLVLGALAAVVTADLPWYTADGSTFNGTAITGGVAQALAVAVLAGSLLMLALRRTGRRIVAVLVGVIALLALVTMPIQRPTSTEVLTELRKQTLDDSYQLHLVGGNVGYAVSCLLVLAGAVIVLLRAHRWPERVDRFERRATAPGPVATGADADPAAIWRSIDAGQDPTVERESTERPEQRR